MNDELYLLLRCMFPRKAITQEGNGYRVKSVLFTLENGMLHNQLVHRLHLYAGDKFIGQEVHKRFIFSQEREECPYTSIKRTFLQLDRRVEKLDAQNVRMGRIYAMEYDNH